MMCSITDVLLQPIFIHCFSGSLHLILLLALFISWVCEKFKGVNGEGQNERSENTKSLYYKQALICCLGVSSFNLVLCLLYYFIWFRNDLSEESLVTLLDLALKTLAWGLVSVYLFTRFTHSGESRHPLLLRVWWGLYFSLSCYSLVIDFVLYKKHVSLQIQSSVSNVVSVISGLFFIYVGLSEKKEGGDSLLEEPLLNSNTGLENDHEVGSKTKGDETVTPYSNAGIFSILSFSWMSPLIVLGKKKTLDLEDVPQLASNDSANGVFSSFINRLDSDCGAVNKVTTLKLVKGLLLSSWKEILFAAFAAFLYAIALYVGPYLINTFVQYLNGERQFQHEGYILVSTFFVAKILECFSQRQWYFILQLVGVRFRAALISTIYQKSLTLSCQSKQGHTSGEIINFMTIDAERVGDFSRFMHDPWMALLQVFLALLILYKNLGLASAATFFAIILVMLANVPLGKFLVKYQNKLMELKDDRMKATSEILRNMRILKLQGWEMKFLSKIIELRGNETGWLKRYLYAWATTLFLLWVAPTFISVATFCACMLLGIPLESGKILSALATFRILQEPIYNLPATIQIIAQTKVSLDRISTFLRLDDLQSDVVEKFPRGTIDIAIEITNGNFSWDLSSQNTTLRNISFRVFPGMKVAVCGTVGSGKSSLLSSILGEIPKISGTVKLCGTKAYVAQLPWIQSGKIEENILFGKQMDRQKYQRVLQACSLMKDLEILSFGDQTVIGERGINLSGGQKQRIQIARALYEDADIYLLDDPFSAVDAHTGSHLFKECLLGLMSSKTVMYVTHQVDFLPVADLILVMKDGRITQAGKYNDILNSGTDFVELVGAHKEALSTIKADLDEVTPLGDKDEKLASTSKVMKKEEIEAVVESKQQLVQEEEREKGKVGFSVYWQYLTKAYGGALVPFILLAETLFQILQIGSNYWMAWAAPASEDEEPSVGGTKLILVYVALAIGSSFCVLARSMLLVTAGYKTATLLFNQMHFCIFRAPMSFFDATPSGRILNRASTDQGAIDMNIWYAVGLFAFTMIQLTGVIAVMSQIAWQVFFIFIPVILICLWYQQYYIPSVRELARLVGVRKAPIIQHFAETISGSETIRSFDQESRFQETNMKLIDGFSRPKFHTAALREWLCFRLDALSSLIFTFFLVFLISLPKGVIDPGVAGLAVTYGLNLNTLQALVILFLGNMENRMISIERIFQYLNISSEPPLVIESNRPDHSWPSCGEVEIQDLQVRYAPHMPLVLRGFSCTFPGGMKTGIVGRTGCGKSTLIQTLFRIVEPAVGQITIDGINISSIGLHDLRSRLSIIPQEPTMFEGTVRSNLDPLEEYTDEQIWEV
ncbi:hypothetical protein UlMin_006969, partial [Ulmus minor]